MRYFSRSYLSVTVAAVLISGCDGSSSPDNSITSAVTKSLSGVVISGNQYFPGAFVCLDLDNNSRCDANEPSTIASDEGEFSLSLNETTYQTAISDGYFLANQHNPKLAKNSDISSLIGFVNVNKSVISPISTLVFNTAEQAHSLSKENRNIEVAKAKRVVIKQLNLQSVSSDELLHDYIESEQSELTALAEKVQKDLVRSETIQAEAQITYGKDWDQIKGYAGFVFESDYQTNESQLYQVESIQLSKQDDDGNVIERQIGNKWRTNAQLEDHKGVFSDSYDQTNYWFKNGTLSQEVYWSRNPFALESLDECASCYNENEEFITLKGEKYAWGTWSFANGKDGYRNIQTHEVYNEGDLDEVPSQYKVMPDRKYEHDCNLKSQESNFNQEVITLDSCIDFVQTRDISESTQDDTHTQKDIMSEWKMGTALDLTKPNYREVRTDIFDSKGNYTNTRQQDWNADGQFNTIIETSVTLNSDLSETTLTSVASPVWPTVDEAREYGAYNYQGKRGLAYWLELTESLTKYADNNESGLKSTQRLYVLDEKSNIPYLNEHNEPVMFAQFETMPHEIGDTKIVHSKWEHRFIDIVVGDKDLSEYTQDNLGQNVVLTVNFGKDQQAYRYSEWGTQGIELVKSIKEALEQGAKVGKLHNYLPNELNEIDKAIIGDSITNKNWYWVLKNSDGEFESFEYAPDDFRTFDKVSLKSDKTNNLWVHNISGELMRFESFDKTSTCTWWECFKLQQIKPQNGQDLTADITEWLADVEIVTGNDSKEHYIGYFFSTEQAAKDFVAEKLGH